MNDLDAEPFRYVRLREPPYSDDDLRALAATLRGRRPTSTSATRTSRPRRPTRRGCASSSPRGLRDRRRRRRRAAASSRRARRRRAARRPRRRSRRRRCGRRARGTRRRRRASARPDDEVVERAPGEHDARRARASRAAPGRSSCVQRSRELRQPDDAEVDPGREHERDQHDREPREAQRTPRGAAPARPARRRRRASTSPPTQSDAAERCTQSASSRLPRRAGVDRVVARERQPRREGERERERRPEQHRRGRAATRGRRARRRARSRASSRRTPCRSACRPRSATGRRRGTSRTAAGARPRSGGRTRAIPSSSTPTTPIPASDVRAASRPRGGSGEPAQADEPEAERADRERERDEVQPSARRARCASARPRRRPPSAAAPARGRRTSRRPRRRASRPRARASAPCTRRSAAAAPARRRRVPRRPRGAGVVAARAVEHLDRRAASTNWSKCSRIDLRRALEPLLEPRRDARAASRAPRPPPGTQSASSERREREPPHRCGAPASGERWPKTGATSRSQKSITASAIIDDREAGLQHDRARPQDERERHERAEHERPAEQVVQERRAGEEPGVLLVDEERDARDGERDRRREPPPAAVQLPVREAELGRAHQHQRLRPRAVREHVDRRVGVEGHHRPHQDAEREREPGPEVDAPRRGGARPPRPTIASASRSRPRSRTPVANSQCTISLGAAPSLPRGRRRSGRATTSAKHDPGRDHEQRRLDQEPPEALAARVQQRDPVRLEDRPDDAGRRTVTGPSSATSACARRPAADRRVARHER